MQFFAVTAVSVVIFRAYKFNIKRNVPNGLLEVSLGGRVLELVAVRWYGVVVKCCYPF